ncbi:hypothetical protein IFM51744_06256 [Aspergillus udagawae]|uniref:Uncharacterized protein n=1 Tax=Aspergillus udagawae TaxID=91492 RepID=A0ABQ1APY0_9EURO|nr:hypothetical protein IFM51744_06256 [Aspergillus udagawae]GFF85902.1 hypothetical protein IFM53868_04636 [Aspergillus udagawae]GFG02557.1 hypothetical protein IFM5058_00995 [Aspergillus udagawae]
MGYDTTDAKYCCGSVVDNKRGDGDPFTIENGAVIPGVAALAGYSNASSITNTTCSNPSSITNTTCPTGNSSSPSSHDVAIGAGVGLPLAVLALASIAWALWARRHCKYMLAWRVCRRPELRRQVNTDINIPRTVYINRIRRSSRKPGWYRSWTATGTQNSLPPYLSDIGQQVFRLCIM